jgi:hypothetical protein
VRGRSRVRIPVAAKRAKNAAKGGWLTVGGLPGLIAIFWSDFMIFWKRPPLQIGHF